MEEWNEFGELKENIGNVPAHNDTSGHTVQTGVNIAPPIPIKPTATQGTTSISQPSPVSKAPIADVDENKPRPLPGAAEIEERNKKQQQQATPPEQAGVKSVVDENVPPRGVESMTSAPAEKEGSINAAKKLLGEEQGRGVDHLSAPPSAMQSGTATPDPEPVESTATTEKPAGLDAGDAEGQQKLTHRGSEVKDAPSEEIKKIESENSLAEDAEEEVEPKEVKDVREKEKDVAAVEASDGGEGKVAEEVKEQSAKEGADAGKSVGD